MPFVRVSNGGTALDGKYIKFANFNNGIQSYNMTSSITLEGNLNVDVFCDVSNYSSFRYTSPSGSSVEGVIAYASNDFLTWTRVNTGSTIGSYKYLAVQNRNENTRYVLFSWTSEYTLTTKIVTTSTQGSGAKVSVKVYKEDGTQIASVEPNTAGTTLYAVPTGLIDYRGQSSGWIFKFAYTTKRGSTTYSPNQSISWAYNSSVNYTLTTVITV